MGYYTGCCVDFYQLPITQFLLGDSFHPGGLKLTTQLTKQLLIGRDSRVLDVASGSGATSLYVAELYGCEIVALDLAKNNLHQAENTAVQKNLSAQYSSVSANAENLPFADNSFDAIICECALCTFGDPQRAIAEMLRVLKPNGRIGISDIVLNQPLPLALKNLFAGVFCISGARSGEQYVELLNNGGFTKIKQSPANWAIIDMIGKIERQSKLLSFAKKDPQFSIPDWLIESKTTIRAIKEFVQKDGLGYMLLTGQKRTGS